MELETLKQGYRQLKRSYGDARIKVILRSPGYKGFTVNENILITGAPRSGTTWFAQMFESYFDRVLIFEPLHPMHCQKLGLFPRQYIPEGECWADLKKYLESVMSGKNLNAWMMSYSAYNQLKTNKHAVIKFVRANLMLPWLLENFEFKYKPIHLVRHPFSVAVSQVNLGWEISKSNYVSDRAIEVHSKYSEKYKAAFESANTPFQRAVVTWCFDNAYLLTHPLRDKSWITVFYEEIYSQPEIEFQVIVGKMGLSHGRGMMGSLDFNKVSPTTVRGAAIPKNKIDQLAKWKKKVSDDDLVAGLEILRTFNITEYSDQIMPHTCRIKE